MIYQHEETGYVTETDSILNYPWFEIGGDMTKGNIYHDCFELTVQDIRFRIEEMEKEETENKDNHLTYQSLLKFFTMCGILSTHNAKLRRSGAIRSNVRLSVFLEVCNEGK